MGNTAVGKTKQGDDIVLQAGEGDAKDPNGANIKITGGDSFMETDEKEVNGGTVYLTGGKSRGGAGGDVNLNPGTSETGPNGSIQIGVQTAPATITIGNSNMTEPVIIGSSLYIGNRGRMLQIQTGKETDFAGSYNFAPSDQGVKVIANTNIKAGDIILFSPVEFDTIMAWPTYTICPGNCFTIRLRNFTGAVESNYTGLVSWFIVRPVPL